MTVLDPPTKELVVHAAHAHWALGEFGPCVAVIWRGQVTEEALRQIGDRLTNLTQRRPGNCAYINVIERDSTPPSAPLRKIAMADLTRVGTALTCLGAVIEGNEFRAALVRAIMTGMSLLRAQGQPTKFFKTVVEMSKWVQGQLREVHDLDAEEIVRSVELLRAQMPTKSP